MEEFKTYTLEELSLNKGTYGIAASAVPYDDSKLTYLRITDINDDGTLNTQSLMSVDEPNASDYLLKKNDIVFARTGNSTGRTYFYQGNECPLVYAGFLIKFSIDEKKVNPLLLKYYTHSRIYYDWVKSFDTGGTRGNINAKTYGNMPIRIPASRKTQDKIVDILSSLDEKIALNRRINDNLEQQAQALFKSWFVDFEPFKEGKFVDSEMGMIPEGWKVGRLCDFAIITMGQSPSGDSYNENKEGMVFYQGRSEFGNRFPSIKLYTTDPNRIAEKNSILISVRAPVGDINIASQDCCIGRGLASIKARGNYNSFLYYTVKSMKKEFDVYNGEGTVFGSINKDSLNSMPVIIPTTEEISNFEKITSVLDYNYEKCHRENIILTSLRDNLLPRLMSGELKINDLNC